MPDIVVLPRKVHGLSPADYVAAIEDELPGATVVLAETPSDRERLLPGARVVTGYDVSRADRELAGEMELFACIYAGTDHVDVAGLTADGVAVTNAAGVHAPNAAEQAVASLLAFARGLDVGFDRSRRGVWQHYQSDELHGSTVTVVGMGTIGTAVLERLAPFGVERVGVRHTPSKGGPAAEIHGYDALPEVLPETDHLVLACPLTETTERLIDEAALERLPPDATIVNVARGPIVDTDALLSALRNNHVGAAALDVTDPEPLPHDHELWDMDRCLITPHNAGYTPRYWERRAAIIARNYERLGTDAELENRVR
ncbi:MAG: D-2-hydroxyacid dehydrogenase [Haloarculaceae archaeon]